MLNKVERLSELVGNRRALAKIIGRDPSVVSRMITANAIRPEFNASIRAWVAEHEPPFTAKEASAILGLLDTDRCPTCGQPLPHGLVL